MAAYTPSLRLTLPVTGTDDGTWGDTVNNGITSLTDSSIAGTATVIQGDVANYTLTNLSGATDEARNMFLNITGALTAARNVICPAASKLYFIKNSTTGGFAVTLKTSGGSGISVPAGSITALYCDGTNVVDAITYANIPVINATTVDTTNLEVTNIKAKDGTASIVLADSTGVATINAAPILTALTASQAVFTNGSKALVSNAITGTGNVVMSTSPTLVTPILGTPASGTVTNLTGTASININGTVGATTANTGAFTTLTTSSTVTLNGGTANGVAYLNGSKVLTTGSALTFDGTNLSNSGNYISTAAVGRFVKSNITGRSLITGGTTGGTTDGAYIITEGYDYGGTAAGGAISLVTAGASSPITFLINGSEGMRLTSTGLGIGTSSPAYKLDVLNTNAIIGGVIGARLTTGAGTFAVTGANPRGTGLIVNGNAGLNVTIPIGGNYDTFGIISAAQTGAGAYPTTAIYGYSNSGTGNGYGLRTDVIGTGTVNYGLYVGGVTGATSNYGIYVNDTSATNYIGGNVGIGTSSPVSKLQSVSAVSALTSNAGFSSLPVTVSDSTALAADTGGGINFNAIITAGGVYNSIAAIKAGRSIATVFDYRGYLSFYTGSNATGYPLENMRLDASGNLGLGVTPSAWATLIGFDISTWGSLGGYTNQINLSGNAYYSSGWKYKQTGVSSRYLQDTSGAHQWLTAPSGTAGAAITFTQAMTLDASGNLLVGTTTTNLIGTDTSGTAITGTGRFDINRNGDCPMFLGRYTSTGDLLQFYYAGALKGSISTNGTTTSYNVTSDERLKENIQDAAPASALIDALQVRQYDWKADGTHQRYGFIAQELVTVAPEAVHQPTDPDDMMAVDYSKLVPMLVKEIQSLRKRLTALEAK